MRAKRSIQADSNFCFVLFFHFICNVFLFLICLERFRSDFSDYVLRHWCGWKFHPGFDAYVRYMYEGVLQSFTCIASKWCFPRWWRLPNRRQTCSRFFYRSSCFFSRVQNHSKKDIRKTHFGLLGSIQRWLLV